MKEGFFAVGMRKTLGMRRRFDQRHAFSQRRRTSARAKARVEERRRRHGENRRAHRLEGFDARKHRAGCRHGGARGRARRRFGQEGNADGVSARHGAACPRRPRDGRQDGQRSAQCRRDGSGGPQGRAFPRRAFGEDGRRGGRRHAARPRPADGGAPFDQRHHRRDFRHLPRHGLFGGARPRSRDRLLQLPGAQCSRRPSLPRHAGHVLHGRPLGRPCGRARRIQGAAAHPDVGRAGAYDGRAKAAHLYHRPRQGVSPRRGRSEPSAARWKVLSSTRASRSAT